ncbi:MAG TPA: hypothetical protein DDY77_00335, partial [Clostridiales bacterium]|nr:hypothetical protein [Clostridiales bacterium]
GGPPSPQGGMSADIIVNLRDEKGQFLNSVHKKLKVENGKLKAIFDGFFLFDLPPIFKKSLWGRGT